MRRSREGAWIEIRTLSLSTMITLCRSREGAWIEILNWLIVIEVAEGRSREGAWIEIPYNRQALKHQHVAPVRERGLK